VCFVEMFVGMTGALSRGGDVIVFGGLVRGCMLAKH